jgi:hypothetical protein
METFINFTDNLKTHIKKLGEFSTIYVKKHPICDGDKPIPKVLLEKIFKVKITRYNYKKYRKNFLKRCNELMNSFEKNYNLYDTIFSLIPKECEIKNRALEIVTNIIIFFTSLGFSWSMYLTAWPSGRKIIKDLFISTDKVTAITNLIFIIKSVYICNGYDDYFFKRELFNLLPIPLFNDLVKDTYLENFFTLFILDKITTFGLIQLIQKYNKKDE